jgi:anti-sigma B factor antagonist
MDEGDVDGRAAEARRQARELRDDAGALRAESRQAVRRAAGLVIRCRTTAAMSEVLLEGELDLETVPAVRAVLADARAARAETRLDLSGLTFVDSTGVRLLLEQAGLAEQDGWSLVLGRPSARVARTLSLTGVDDRLPFAG